MLEISFISKSPCYKVINVTIIFVLLKSQFKKLANVLLY